MIQIKIKKGTVSLYSIIIYIIFTMVSNSSGDILTQIARIILVSVLGIQMLRKLVLRKKVILYITWIVFFLLYAFIGCFYAYSQSYAIDFTLTLMYIVICNICMVIYLSNSIYDIETILKVMILGAILKAIRCYATNGLLCFLFARSTEEISANIIGYYCAFACILCLYFRKKTQNNIYSIGFVLNFVFMILSASRKAFLFLLIPIGVKMILKSKNPKIVIRNIIIVVVVAVILLFVCLKVEFLYMLIGSRIEGAINGLLGIGTADSSTNTRMSLIADGMKWFREKPIWGYGLSNFKALCAYYRSWGTTYYAHNNYVELLVDCGIVGTVLYYSLHFKMFMKGFKERTKLSELQKMLFGMLISILICDYGMVSYFDIFTQTMLMIVYIAFYCAEVIVYNKNM